MRKFVPAAINILAFQVLWISLVLSGPYQQEAAALGLLGLWLIGHLYYSRHRATDIKLLVLAVAIGPLGDTLLIQLGLIQFEGTVLFSGLPPLWVYGLWACFSQLLNHGMAHLHGRWGLIGIIALFSAPMAYTGGAALGAAQMLEPAWRCQLAVAVCWSIILPVLMRAASMARASQAHAPQ